MNQDQTSEKPPFQHPARVAEAIEGIINPDGKGTHIVTTTLTSGKPQIVPHGWVVPRKDNLKAKCMGPEQCKHCQEEQRRIEAGTYPYAVEDAEAATPSVENPDPEDG